MDKPTLVIYRNTLATIKPQLLEVGTEADPIFCKDPFLELVMLRERFSDLAKEIMAKIGAENYMLID